MVLPGNGLLITSHIVMQRNITSRFSINSETGVSELLENLEEIITVVNEHMTA